MGIQAFLHRLARDRSQREQVYHTEELPERPATFAAVSLPDLGAGLSWDTTQLYTTGEISVAAQNLAIPEPATLTLLSLGGLGLLARRRRQR